MKIVRLVCFGLLFNIMVQCCLETDGLRIKNDAILVAQQRHELIVAWLLDQQRISRLGYVNCDDDQQDVSAVTSRRAKNLGIRRKTGRIKNKMPVPFGDL